MENNLFNWKS